MNIRFMSKEAFERYCDCSWKTEGMKRSLDDEMKTLMRMGWDDHESTACISCDFHDRSFFFRVLHGNGEWGMTGGIIFHGKWNEVKDDFGVTKVVPENEHDGYSIHT